MVCADGYRQSVGGACLLCESGELKVGDATGIGFLLFVVLGSAYACWWHRGRSRAAHNKRNSMAARGYREPSKSGVQRALSSAIIKVKIMTAHQQVRQGGLQQALGAFSACCCVCEGCDGLTDLH